jgi:hypothetical protein
MRAYVCLPGGVLSTSSHMHSCVHSTRHAARTGRGDRAGVRGLQDSDCNAATAAARSPARMAYGAQRSAAQRALSIVGLRGRGGGWNAMRCDAMGSDGMGWDVRREQLDVRAQGRCERS